MVIELEVIDSEFRCVLAIALDYYSQARLDLALSREAMVAFGMVGHNGPARPRAKGHSQPSRLVAVGVPVS
jgi:hypothetical protein